MLKVINRLLEWLQGGGLRLLILAGLILLVWGTVSPVGTLVWWLNQEVESLGLGQGRPQVLTNKPDSSSKLSSSQLNCYIVFLPGVGDFSADQLTGEEAMFLKQLEQQHPGCVAVSDVFPYSASNESLSGDRFLAPLWQSADQAKGWLAIANSLIKIRNLWRFAISADYRYGPIYNQGIATAILERMEAAHPISPTRSLKIILLGTSGGVQVALGAASYLQQWLPAKLTIVSLGGVFSGTNGFEAVHHVYHLRGRRDWVDDLGNILFPSRWPWIVNSSFNQARRQDRFTTQILGSHAHDGPQGYFGDAKVNASDQTYVQATLQQVNQLPIWQD